MPGILQASPPAALVDGVGSVALEHIDQRTDEELVAVLAHPPPVTSEKNVWAFWDSGFAGMRPWQQRNVLGWIRLLGPTWTVRVLDLGEGSDAHVRKFVDAKHFPRAFNDGTMTGRFRGHHASDMVRLPCLFEHGGVYMDVGIMLFAHLDDVCWDGLTQGKLQVALASADPSLVSGLAENFFIAARRGSGFIQRWMAIFLAAWGDRTDCTGIHSHPLLAPLLDDGRLARFFAVASGDKLDYFAQQLAYERLRMIEDPSDGFSGPNFCKTRVLLLPYREFASGAMLTENDGPKQHQMLSTMCAAEGKAFEEAREYCYYMLSQTAMMKLYHWKEETLPTLADMWDRPENKGADQAPGTFAEFLRYMSTHYRPRRKPETVKFPDLNGEAIVGGLLEEDDE